MKNIDELIRKICEKNNYEKIMSEIMSNYKENKITEVLNEISENEQLNNEQKKELYTKIFEHINDINKYYEEKIEEIYLQGFKEATIEMLIIDRCTKDENGKRDETLEICINDYINQRLETQNNLEKNSEYQKILEKLKSETKKIEHIDILEQLYENRRDIENRDSYQIGFQDALKMMLNKDFSKEIK